MTSSASLLGLPVELIETIAIHPSLSLCDICKLSQTCQHLYVLVTRLWPKIAHSRWDYWDSYTAQTVSEWRKLCIERHLCQCHSETILNALSEKGVRVFLPDDEDMEAFCDMTGEYYPQWYSSSKKASIIPICSRAMLMCTLRDILRKDIGQADLTHQFYALHAYEFLERQRLVEEWKRLLNLPEGLQQMEAGAILLTQWIDPYGSPPTSSITQQLDHISLLVASELLRISQDGTETPCSPDDSQTLCSPSSSDVGMEQVLALNLPRDLVLKTISNVLYAKLGFRGAHQHEYYQLDSSLIDQVLKNRCGIPISLSTVYQSVACRLGIRLVPVNFPSHFLLKAPQKISGGIEVPEVFIDAFNKGTQLSREECLDLVPFIHPSDQFFNTSAHYQVYLRMIANIYSRGSFMFALEISRSWDKCRQHWGPLVIPGAFSLQLHLCSMCPSSDMIKAVISDVATMSLNLNFNNKLVETILSKYSSFLPLVQLAHAVRQRQLTLLEEPVKVEHRDPSKVCYTIGMIMKHKRYDYHCVVYGWDYQCEMSQDWIVQMGVDHLPLGPNQPFYNVLVEDGSNRYAAQESLFPCPKDELCPITHWEVGKYFSFYTGDAYVPNSALNAKYPD